MRRATQYYVEASKESVMVKFVIDAGSTKEALEVGRKEVFDIFVVEDRHRDKL